MEVGDGVTRPPPLVGWTSATFLRSIWPLSVRIREYAQQFGVLFLVLLMLVVMVFDINRLLTSLFSG